MGADFSVSNSVEVIAMRRNWAMLALRLLAGLAYLHRDLQRLAAATQARAAHWCRAEGIQTDRPAHGRLCDADSVGRIEADPAEVFDIGLGPSVARLLRGHAVGAVQVTTDITRRNTELT